MRRETFELLKKSGVNNLDDIETFLVKPLEKLREKTGENGVPTVSFKIKNLKSVKENSKTILEFLINGEHVGIGGTKYSIELICDSKSVTFTTNTWVAEKGFVIKTTITTKDPEVINIAFKFDGKESNSLNLNVATTQVEKPEKCLCKKSMWTADDVKYIITQLRKKDDIISQREFDNKKNPYFADENGKKVSSNANGKAPKEGYNYYYKKTSLYDRPDADKKPLKDRIFFYKTVAFNLDKEYATHTVFAKFLNQVFQKYNIDKCIQKIHFLAQMYVETSLLRTTYEINPKSNYSGGIYYRGRGMKQITHDYNYLAYYDVRKGKGKGLNELYRKNRNENFDPKKGPIFTESVVAFNARTENEYISIEEMEKFDEFVSLISTSIYWAFDSAGWYWNDNKLNDFADDSDDALRIVSAKINNPDAALSTSSEGINQFGLRQKYYESLKEIFDYENCK